MRQIEETIGLLIGRISRAHRNRALAALSSLGLHPVQELILLQLWEEEGITQSQIAERLGIEAPTVTKILQRLERNGFVKRCQDEDDARISRVYLTPTSRGLEEPVVDIWHSLEERTLDGLTDTERMLLRRLLLHIKDNLDGC